MQPLVKEAQTLFKTQSKTIQNSSQANKGLVFDRFFDGYSDDFSVAQGKDTDELSKLVGACGNSQQLRDSATRRIQLTTALGGKFGVFKTDWHFVTGMGNNHPAENGFSWHRTLGTPYLPGSAVKGLLRAWMEEWQLGGEDNKEERAELVHAWFGRDAKTEGSSDGGKAGDLIFFDALPVEPPTVQVDIMTPHMGKWYEKGDGRIDAESQPGDWHSPVPVSFLVTSDARFVFAIAPRTEAAKKHVEEAFEHLQKALAWLGAGAKTAAGYGHMSFDEKDSLDRFKRAKREQEEAEQARLLASLSEEQQIIASFTQRRKAGEDKNVGGGGQLAQDMAAACEAAEGWSAEDKKALDAEARAVLKHVGINLRKNNRWRQRLNALAE